jgi:hypothetical protein
MQFDFFEDLNAALILFKNMIPNPFFFFFFFFSFQYSNPSLRVAYIDEVEERESGKVQKVYYSVLVKAVDNLDQVIVICNVNRATILIYKDRH